MNSKPGIFAWMSATPIILALLLLILATFTVALTSAEVTALDVTPTEVEPGGVITISGMAAPNEAVWVSSSFELSLPVSDGGNYSHEFNNFYFPQGEKTFCITTENIKNVQVSLSPILGQTATITCSEQNMTVKISGVTIDTRELAESIDETGVATISVSFPVSIGPLTLDISGKKDIKVEGDAADGATSVNLKVSASVKVIADSNGDFSLPINTEGVPEGEFLISAGGIEKTVYIGVTPTPTPSPCFIATAAYGTPLHEDIDVLRDFRDEYLMPNTIGKEFVKVYYETSPPIADVIRENEGLRTVVREGLVEPLVHVTRWFVR